MTTPALASRQPDRKQIGRKPPASSRNPALSTARECAHTPARMIARRLLVPALVTAAAVAAYWPALSGPPVWDDAAHLTAPELRPWSGLGRIWTEPGATQQYYPLLHAVFWLQHRLWGDAPAGYHLACLAQHLLAAGLFALLLRRLAVPGAALAAAIFALHPVQVESVAWISEQKNTLSLVLALGAALVYLRFEDTRRRRDYAVASALFAAALLTKSITATLPAALLVLGWWRRGRLDWRTNVAPLLPWLLTGAGAGLFTAWMERHVIGAYGAMSDLGLAERLLLAGRVPWFYLGQLAWPADLGFIYPRWALDPGAAVQWLPAVATVALLAALWAGRRRTRTPLAAGLLFGGLLFPVLGFLDVYPFRYSFVADHFQYHASLVPIALAAAGLALACRRLPDPLRAGLAVAALAGLALLTAHSTPRFRDAETLYRATLARNPAAAMAHNNLALLLAARGARDEALGHLREALRWRPEDFDAHNNLGLLLTQAGRPAEALPHARRAVHLQPASGEAWNNLGITLAALQRPAEAVVAFRSGLRFRPDSDRLRNNYTKALRLAAP
jgi:tetratricopeptide (TPR) repeat protein